MEKLRMLNRIVEINIANVKYADIELNGHTCFVGTNNYGKTTLQRAILFFYSANSRGLGISASQKSFEEHYFRYENSYIVYEVSTEENPFLVIVYRHNKLVYRFVDAAYNPDFFFKDDEAMKIKEIVSGLEKRGIFVSHQIDTFERYRNIIYGTETDKLLSKFHLLKGNEKYQNIPKSITNVFLSSRSSIDSRFIKDFIANSLNTENISIPLDQIERQLRQFNEKYTDIETFQKQETQQLIKLIDEKYDRIQILKGQQMDMAENLGSTVRFAEKQNDLTLGEVKKKEQELEQLLEKFEADKNAIEEKRNEVREEIGYLDRTIRDANKRLKEYSDKNIEEALEKYKEREALQIELNMARREHEALTGNVANMELKYASLQEQLRNDKQAFINRMDARMAEVLNHFNELQLIQKNEFQRQEEELRRKKDAELQNLQAQITERQIELNQLQSEQKLIKNTRYYDDEIRSLDVQLQEIRGIIYKNKSDAAIKQNRIDSLQKDWENEEYKLNQKLQLEIREGERTILEHKERIRKLEEQLSAHSDALYGFLEKNMPGWKDTVGKVIHEDLLFRSDLQPKLSEQDSKSIFGLELNLEKVDSSVKTIERIQLEIREAKESVREIEQRLQLLQEQHHQEKLLLADKYGKELAYEKDELKTLLYALEMAGKKEKKILAEKEEWLKKAEEESDQALKGNRQKLNVLEEELSVLNKKKNLILETFEEQWNKIQTHHEDRIQDIKARREDEFAKLEVEKKNGIKEFEKKEDELINEKEHQYKSKGVDAKELKKVEQRIRELQDKILEIDAVTSLVNDYLKDKRELFDKLPDLHHQKELLVKQAHELAQQTDELQQKYNLQRLEINKAKKALEEEIINFNTGLNFYHQTFKDSPTYKKFAHIIEKAEPKRTHYNITELCSAMLKNDSVYNEEYNAFYRYVNEFCGKFRLDNHFNFVIRAEATPEEYERFAQNLRAFIHENKIALSIAETATQISMVTDSIATKVRDLSNQQGKITHIIGLLAEDFKKAEFEKSKLIDYIKVKVEDSDNKVYRLLKKIEEFREEHGLVYNQGLFNNDFATQGKREISMKAVRLLEQLRSAIKEQEQEEIRLQDLFELKFNIKEGMNETGWTHRIDSIGSTGTDILVKAIIYITLLHVFIKESSHRSSKDFRVHCIIDEVGQISAHYLKELLAFARSRNIMMINGLPNKSGLESHYKYTYQFRKEENGNVRIFPSIVTEVEV